MKPILYQPTTKDFGNNGIGVLSDAAFCEVTEERNGILELVLDYPINGIHFSEIKQRSIITAKPNPTADAQPFRVYKITKPLNGMVTVYAEHISYDLSGIAVTPFSAGSAAAALQALKTNSVVNNPFEFWTDKSTVAEMNVKTPASVRAMLGGVQGSVLDTYGGEYEWDGFTVKLHNERGQNRGVSIRYGKNLTDLEQEENCANVYTAVMPFWADNEGNNVLLQERIVEVPGNFDFVRVLTLDLSNEFDAQPSQDELRDRAQKYIDDNNIGVPKVSLRVSFVPLEQTEEYKNIALLERVNLCDTVNVEFEKLGVSATAKVVKTVFDVLLDRYKSVELGDARSNIADTLIKQDQAIKDAPKKAMSIVAQAAENASQLITGNRGGYVVIRSSTGATQPDEILIMDTPSVETATKVWRWNNSGLGYSETGYNGTYTTALTIDGAFNADFITAGSISANLIKSGLLKSLNEVTTFDLDSGAIKIQLYDSKEMVINEDGMTIYSGQEIVAKYSALQTTSSFGEFTYLEIFDSGNGSKVAQLSSSTTGGSLSLFKKTNLHSPINLMADEKGGHIGLYKHEGDIGKAVIYLLANEDEGNKIQLTDGNVIVNNGDVLLYDSNNTLNVQLHEYEGYGGQVVVFDDSATTEGALICNGGGELRLFDATGSEKIRLVGREDCAEIRVGGGGQSWRMMWNDGESNVKADHFYFLNKTEGLFTSNRFPVAECSAYIVYGQPTKGGYYSSVIIPANRATDRTWQIADESNYIKFTIDSDGNVTRTGGSSNSGTSLSIYAIR